MSAVVRSSILLSLALFLGRIAGFLREMVLAAKLGVSQDADVAILLLTLPDLLVAVLLAGGFSAALVPALRRLAPEERTGLFGTAALWAGIGFAGFAALLAAFPNLVFLALAPGMAGIEPYLPLVRIVALSLPLAALTGVVAAYLQSHDRFFVAGLGSLAYNGTLILVLVTVFDAQTAFGALALGVVIAAVARLVLLLAAARPPLAKPAAAEAGFPRQFATGVLATGLVALTPILFRTILSLAGDGQIAGFSYALRLYELPVALLFSAMTTVLLPRLTDAYAAPTPSHHLFHDAARVMLALALITLAVAQIFGDALVTLIYQRGEMTAAGQTLIATNARWLFASLPMTALAMLSAVALNAQRRNGRVLVNVALALGVGALVALLLPARPLIGFLIFQGVQMVLNLHALRPGWPSGLGSMTRPLIISVGCIAAGWAITRALPDGLHPFWSSLLALVIWGLAVAVWGRVIRAIASGR